MSTIAADTQAQVSISASGSSSSVSAVLDFFSRFDAGRSPDPRLIEAVLFGGPYPLESTASTTAPRRSPLSATSSGGDAADNGDDDLPEMVPLWFVLYCLSLAYGGVRIPASVEVTAQLKAVLEGADGDCLDAAKAAATIPGHTMSLWQTRCRPLLPSVSLAQPLRGRGGSTTTTWNTAPPPTHFVSAGPRSSPKPSMETVNSIANALSHPDGAAGVAPAVQAFRFMGRRALIDHGRLCVTLLADSHEDDCRSLVSQHVDDNTAELRKAADAFSRQFVSTDLCQLAPFRASSAPNLAALVRSAQFGGGGGGRGVRSGGGSPTSDDDASRSSVCSSLSTSVDGRSLCSPVDWAAGDSDVF